MATSRAESSLNNIVLQQQTDQLQKRRLSRLLASLVGFSFIFFVAMHSLAVAASNSPSDTSTLLATETTVSQKQQRIERSKAAGHLDKANRYYNGGDDFPQDYTLAREHYEKAAKYYTDGKRALAALNYTGLGGPKDLTKARYWAEQAAEQAADCQFMLGVLYAEGMGVAKDTTKAVYWFEKAANNPYDEFALAQYYLGTLYREGKDVPKDIEKAMYWLEKAFSKRRPQELAQPQEYIEQAVKEGEMIPDFPDWYYANNAEAIDYKGALKWAEKGAEQDDADSQFVLALMYENGKGVAKNTALSIHWLEQAAKQGYAKAQYYLGSMFLKSDDDYNSLRTGMLWLTKAADQGHLDAIRTVADLEEHVDVTMMPAGQTVDSVYPRSEAYGYLLLLMYFEPGNAKHKALEKKYLAKLSPKQITGAQAEADSLWKAIQENKE